MTTEVYCTANSCMMAKDMCEHRYICDCEKRLAPGTYAMETTVIEVDEDQVPWLYLKLAGKVFRTQLNDLEQTS